MPAPTVYEYPTSDLLNGALYAPALRDEIHAESSGIVTQLQLDPEVSLVEGQDVLRLTFKAPLGPDEITALAVVLGAHSGVKPYSLRPILDEHGQAYVRPHPQGFGLEQCDRDFLIRTAVFDPNDPMASYEDLRYEPGSNTEAPWGELTHMGVFKLDNDVMVPCTDPADALQNGIMSGWEYQALDRNDGETPILYEVRDASISIDPSLYQAPRTFDHRLYGTMAPDIPLAYGGQIPVFDGYLDAVPAPHVISTTSSVTKPIDPALGPGTNIIRIVVFHPKNTPAVHLVRMVTYREASK